VRLLRVLSRERHPLTRSELGRRAGLEEKGAHLAADRLLQDGILRRVGSGPRQQVELEQAHPLAAPIQDLFRAERERAEQIITGLKTAALRLSPALDAAWIEGPFALQEDLPGDPITTGLLARSATIENVLDTFSESVAALEAAQDVTIEVKGLTRADLAVAKPAEQNRLRNALVLFGPPPIAFTPSGKEYRAARNALAHGDRDHEQWVLTHEIAQRLISDPAILEAAKEFVAKRLEAASNQERHELREWKRILESMSPSRLQKFLLDTSERATRLRQTMPFLSVLTADEREEILAKVRSS
jgi:hypothetical protein